MWCNATLKKLHTSVFVVLNLNSCNWFEGPLVKRFHDGFSGTEPLTVRNYNGKH